MLKFAWVALVLVLVGCGPDKSGEFLEKNGGTIRVINTYYDSGYVIADGDFEKTGRRVCASGNVNRGIVPRRGERWLVEAHEYRGEVNFKLVQQLEEVK